jgi:hypothetical protein
MAGGMFDRDVGDAEAGWLPTREYNPAAGPALSRDGFGPRGRALYRECMKNGNSHDGGAEQNLHSQLHWREVAPMVDADWQNAVRPVPESAESVPESVTESVPESVSESVPESVESVSESVSESVPESVSESVSEFSADELVAETVDGDDELG